MPWSRCSLSRSPISRTRSRCAGLRDARRLGGRPDLAEQSEQPRDGRGRARTRRGTVGSPSAEGRSEPWSPRGRPARASGGGDRLAASSTGSPAAIGPVGRRRPGPIDSARCPVRASQAWLTQAMRRAGSSQNIGSRACCQSWSGRNAEPRETAMGDRVILVAGRGRDPPRRPRPRLAARPAQQSRHAPFAWAVRRKRANPDGGSPWRAGRRTVSRGRPTPRRMTRTESAGRSLAPDVSGRDRPIGPPRSRGRRPAPARA